MMNHYNMDNDDSTNHYDTIDYINILFINNINILLYG